MALVLGMRAAWIVYAGCCILAAASPADDSVSRMFEHEVPPATEHLAHGTRYIHSMDKTDALGGKIRFNYDATVQHHVEVLDEWPEVHSVSCSADHEITIVGPSASQLEKRLFVGSIIVGSEDWKCVNGKGDIAPFYFEIVAKPWLELDTDSSHNPALTMEAKPTSLESCFSNLRTHVSREPGPHESECFLFG